MSGKPLGFTRLVAAALLSLAGAGAQAACLDNVVLVHGNTGSPADWNNTVATLKGRGYLASQLFLPNWGSKTNPASNDHGTANTSPVKSAMTSAHASSCTGKIDVIGHSMGVTLAMKAINELGYASRVNSFVSVAGAQWGLNSCGVYPYNVITPTCGANGLSIDSPLTRSVRGKRYGAKMYSIKSWIDEVVCYGSCYVYGAHTSNVDLQNSTTDYALGHFGLQTQTTSRQADLLMN
ncbi:lipase [Massilia sp. Dwa41.01b]|uniref:alpha/beta fold hydrolase n=1 Tax=unclassified Massilia TaxID=2609279 RepID=UPI0016039CB7|nr:MULTISPECIES: alpha/beta fold hydrolase [unclassified Massilia]QNA90338.1 lipase [Massilia sp. Dwa41.01b]QNB01238.1 lipase [Massilia sp. Se16.2.3]